MRVSLVAAVTSTQVLQIPMLSNGFHVQSPDGQLYGIRGSDPNMPWYMAPMTLVSLTLSALSQLAGLTVNNSTSARLTIGITGRCLSITISTAFPEGVHVVAPSSTDDASHVIGRHKP
jgi:hypothetical protein